MPRCTQPPPVRGTELPAGGRHDSIPLELRPGPLMGHRGSRNRLSEGSPCGTRLSRLVRRAAGPSCRVWGASGRPGSVVRRREEAGGGASEDGNTRSLCVPPVSARTAGRRAAAPRQGPHATPLPGHPQLHLFRLLLTGFPRVDGAPLPDLQPAPLVDSSLPTRLRLDLDATTPSKPKARNHEAVPTSRRSRAVSTAPGSAHRARALHKPRRGRHLAGRCLALFDGRVTHNLPARLHSTKSSPAAGLGEWRPAPLSRGVEDGRVGDRQGPHPNLGRAESAEGVPDRTEGSRTVLREMRFGSGAWGRAGRGLCSPKSVEEE